MTGKPTVADLNIDPGTQSWLRSGEGSGVIEVAFVQAAAASSDLEEWVLMRVAGDTDGRILVFDRHEWECFLDGARNGEFDDAAHQAGAHSASTRPASTGPAAP